MYCCGEYIWKTLKNSFPKDNHILIKRMHLTFSCCISAWQGCVLSHTLLFHSFFPKSIIWISVFFCSSSVRTFSQKNLHNLLLISSDVPFSYWRDNPFSWSFIWLQWFLTYSSLLLKWYPSWKTRFLLFRPFHLRFPSRIRRSAKLI